MSRSANRAQRFGDTHLGASKASGRAGTYDYPYIAYHESNAAAVLELLSIISVIAGMGAMLFVSFRTEGGLSLAAVVKWAIGIFLANRAFALLAWKVNNVQVRNRIVNDTEYACYFAWKYPAQAHICEELNPAYAANPDTYPEAHFLQKQAEQAKKDAPVIRWIGILGIGFLVIAAIAFIAFIIWVKHETE